MQSLLIVFYIFADCEVGWANMRQRQADHVGPARGRAISLD